MQTAKRVLDALDSDSNARAGKQHPLYYLELNAVSPETAKAIGALFENDQQVGHIHSSFTHTIRCTAPINEDTKDRLSHDNDRNYGPA